MHILNNSCFKSIVHAKPKVYLIFVLTLFSILVIMGLTGSSLDLLFKQSSFIKSNMRHLLFIPQHIRSDEWKVLTPMAISQYNIKPAFPIINNNIGIEGQNMLIIPLTGVPVKHITAIVKPATWGFLIFDLKRALAWYWWFPIFGGFLSLWWLFTILLPDREIMGFFLTLIFCCSPYIVACSNWPAYAIFFPNIALCSLICLLKTRNSFLALVFGCLMGLALAGFVLLQYPPWQISLGFLFIIIAVGITVTQYKSLYFNSQKILAIVLGTALSCSILCSYWLDAQEAIKLMLHTLYPGQRVALTGGDMTFFSLLRGFTNLITINLSFIKMSNQTEMASFYYLFGPLLVALFFKLKKSYELIYLILPISLFMGFIFIYNMYGIPLIIAKITLWDRIPSVRTDLALGLSYILLCGLVLGNTPNGSRNGKITTILIYCISITWTLIILYVMRNFIKTLVIDLAIIVVAVVGLYSFFASISLMQHSINKFILLTLGMCIITTFHFNPLSFAANTITLSPDIKILLTSGISNKSEPKKILILGEELTMAFTSLSIPTINGVMFYPQNKLWSNLGVDTNSNNIVNRFQHLSFILTKFTSSTENFNLTSPFPDIVNVKVDSNRFDFSLTNANVLLAENGAEISLEKNKSVRFISSMDGWSFFNILHPEDQSSRGG